MSEYSDEKKNAKKRSQAEYFKTHYYANEEYRKKHLEKVNEKITCECGCQTSRGNQSKHRKSAKHFMLLEKEQRIKELTKII